MQNKYKNLLVLLFCVGFITACAPFNNQLTDYRRQTWIYGQDWNEDYLWDPIGVPTGPYHRSFFRCNGTVCADAIVTRRWGIGTLDLKGDHTKVTIYDGRLSVFGPTTVDGGIVEVGEDYHDYAFNLFTERLDLGGQGKLRMNGGTLRVWQNPQRSGTGILKADTQSVISGMGTIDFYSSGSNNALILDGLLKPESGTLTLTLNSGSGRLDLDGTSENGVIQIIPVMDFSSRIFYGSHLKVNGPMADPFNSMMIIGRSSSADFNRPWMLGGTLEFNNECDPDFESRHCVAQLLGSKLTTIGPEAKILVHGGTGLIEAPVEFHKNVFVAVDNHSILNLSGLTTYKGGKYSGDGTLFQSADATIEKDTAIDINVYDWDGHGLSQTKINPGVTFTINSRSFGTRFRQQLFPEFKPMNPINVFGGTVILDNGTLTIAHPWYMMGKMDLNQTLSSQAMLPVVRGAMMHVEQNQAGTTSLNVSGNAVIESPVTFSLNPTITINKESELKLKGETIYRGGRYIGEGQLSQIGNAVVEEDTTIEVAKYDWDGNGGNTTVVQPNARFTILSRLTDPYNGRVTVNKGGILTISNFNLSSQGTLNINNGLVKTNTLDNSSGGNLNFPGGVLEVNRGHFITGNGDFIINGIDRPSLILQTGAKADFYGDVHVAENNSAVLVIRRNAQVSVTGSCRIAQDPGSEGHMVVDGNESKLRTSHLVIGNGGSGDLDITNSGLVSVSNSINIGTSGSINLNGGELSAEDIILQDGIFNWDAGRLSIGSFIGNLTNNGGILSCNAPPASTHIEGDYVQTNGVLEVRLAGRESGQHSQMVAAHNVFLGGRLKIILADGFIPSAGDSFDIIKAGSVTGSFTGLYGQHRLFQLGLYYKLNYDNADRVVLEVKSLAGT
ncbi:MAG: hypothetical protein KKE44_01420 [Proteobacteria bacterium]|nr:hypothetical protein [Pseudomonadota bacterium]MBU1581387.1 hypothetical protein [Pseudomonadota bacterium]MBU2628841.1 hypothetical protein [Pseudomonadota bacterium]